jgi:hypothetical protein
MVITNKMLAKINPVYYRMICQGMTLQNSSSLIIPLKDETATDTDTQSSNLIPIVSDILESIQKIGVNQFESFLVPFRQKIISAYSAKSQKSIWSVVNEFDADEFESPFSWARAPLIGRKTKTLTTLSLVRSASFIKPQRYEGIGNLSVFLKITF